MECLIQFDFHTEANSKSIQVPANPGAPNPETLISHGFLIYSECVLDRDDGGDDGDNDRGCDGDGAGEHDGGGDGFYNAGDDGADADVATDDGTDDNHDVDGGGGDGGHDDEDGDVGGRDDDDAHDGTSWL